MADNAPSGITVLVVSCGWCGRVYDVTDRKERIEGTFYCSSACFMAGLEDHE